MKRRGLLVIGLFLPLFLLPLHGQQEDWRATVASFFLSQTDVGDLTAYLESRFSSLESYDQSTAALLLAYSWEKAGDRAKAYTWLARFFEDYRGEGAFIDFLPRTAQNELWAYLKQWQTRYPLVTDLSFLMPAEASPSLSPPDRFVLAVEMTNSAFYKLTSEGETIKAGLLQRGLNTLSLESSPLIRQTGTHTFFLDLKVDDLIIRREIAIEVSLSSELLLNNLPQADISRRYRVSLFFGNRLLAQSQSTIKLTPPIQLTLPPADGRFSPYGPVHPSGQRDPNTIGVSILSLPSVLAQLIKDYKAKREEKERVPPPEIKKEVQLVYLNQTTRGLEKMMADLKLKSKSYQAMVFSVNPS